MTKSTIDINRICRVFLTPISGNATFFVFMYVLSALCVVLVPHDSSRKIALLQLFSDLYILCSLLLLVPTVVRRYLRWILCALFYLVSIVDVVCYTVTGTAFTPLHLQLIQQASSVESRDFLSSYVSWRLLLSPLGGVLLVLFAHVFTVMYRERIRRMTYDIFQCAGIVCSIVTVILTVTGFLVTLDSKEYIYYRIARGLDELEVQRMKELAPKTKYYMPIYRFVYAVSETHRLRFVYWQLEESFAKASVTSCSFRSPEIVLIIGESCSRSHCSLYGYDKPTTPLLDRRTATGRLISFTDVITPWNVTCEAFQSFLSTHCVGMNGSWATYPLFPQLFRMAGYHTAFYSNQYVLTDKSFSDFKEDMFINNREYSSAMFDVRNDSTHCYDDGLLSHYRHQNGINARGRLSIFHFLGVHFDFAQRYPKDRTRFRPEHYDRKDLSETDKKVLADYDNAILYNDYVIDRIINTFEERNAIIIFLSDHGERVFDNGTVEWGRTLVWNNNNVRQQYEIPFWIYVTETYRTTHADIYKRLLAVKDVPMMSDALPHLLMGLAGIDSPWYSEEYDILSEHYNRDRKRILNGERDYSEFSARYTTVVTE